MQLGQHIQNPGHGHCVFQRGNSRAAISMNAQQVRMWHAHAGAGAWHKTANARSSGFGPRPAPEPPATARWMRVHAALAMAMGPAAPDALAVRILPRAMHRPKQRHLQCTYSARPGLH